MARQVWPMNCKAASPLGDAALSSNNRQERYLVVHVSPPTSCASTTLQTGQGSGRSANFRTTGPFLLRQKVTIVSLWPRPEEHTQVGFSDLGARLEGRCLIN